MTLAPNIPEISTPTDITPTPETDQTFNWRNCWYPVTFIQDLPTNRPYSFSLYDEPLVLFRNQDGQLICLSDRCPHRAAKLSDGQIIDGKIECLYHGWQFGSGGKCWHIPQLPADAKIPEKACVKSFLVVEKQGMIWMWAGEPEVAQEQQIPIFSFLERPEFVTTDYMIDLPYNQGYLIENVIDPAHVFISHDGSEGNRKDAKPLEIEILDSSVAGIRGKWRFTHKPNAKWATLDFVAPSLVHYKFGNEENGVCVGLALYSLPTTKNQCRLLLKRYRNILTKSVKLKPRWFQHLRQNRILEEDLSVVVGQQEQIERLTENLNSLYLPLKTSDTLVVEYRKWLDKFGSGLPFRGYCQLNLSGKVSDSNHQPILQDRFSRHTEICSSCSRAHKTAIQLKQTLVGVAIAMAAVAIVIDNTWWQILTVSVSLSAVVLAVVADKVKMKFEQAYTRQPPRVRQKL